jgi:hypothetical protein
MTKLIFTIAALLALAIPASSSAVDTARWLTDPTCTATTTTLTCTGRAVGLQRPNNNPLGSLDAAIFGEVHYICSEPVFTAIEPRFGRLLAVASTEVQNGQTFSIEVSPRPTPTSLTARAACFSGIWTRDPNYYNVSVAIGWGLGPDGFEVTALEAPIGTVSP